jgi:hypothetical protein
MATQVSSMDAPVDALVAAAKAVALKQGLYMAGVGGIGVVLHGAAACLLCPAMPWPDPGLVLSACIERVPCLAAPCVCGLCEIITWSDTRF